MLYLLTFVSIKVTSIFVPGINDNNLSDLEDTEAILFNDTPIILFV